MSTPVMVMSGSLNRIKGPELTLEPSDAPAPQRQSGRKAQVSNIMAAKTVADVLRTVLGPKAMLKMVRSVLVQSVDLDTDEGLQILDPMGGILSASPLSSTKDL